MCSSNHTLELVDVTQEEVIRGLSGFLRQIYIGILYTQAGFKAEFARRFVGDLKARFEYPLGFL